MAKTITTIQINRPLNKTVVSKTLIMRRHKIITQLFDDDFWGMQRRSQEIALNLLPCNFRAIFFASENCAFFAINIADTYEP